MTSMERWFILSHQEGQSVNDKHGEMIYSSLIVLFVFMAPSETLCRIFLIKRFIWYFFKRACENKI